MTTTTTARAILAGGDVSLNMWNTVTQKYDGFKEYLDADKFEIKPNFEEKTSESRSHRDFGQARAAVVLPKPTEISIELSAASVEAMAMQFQGIVQGLTQSAGNQTDQEFTVTQLGVWLPLGKRNISEQGFVVSPEGGGTNLVFGTHYDVSWARGEIKFFEVVGGVALNAKPKIAMSWNALDGKKILGGRVSQVRCQARFTGKNMVDHSPIEVDVHECVLGAGNGFDFLAGDFSAIQLSGKIVVPPGKSEGYEVRFPGV